MTNTFQENAHIHTREFARKLDDSNNPLIRFHEKFEDPQEPLNDWGKKIKQIIGLLPKEESKVNGNSENNNSESDEGLSATFINACRILFKKRMLYLVNHSLGVKPRKLRHHQEFHEMWKYLQVEGHWLGGEEKGWLWYDERFLPLLKEIFGAAKESEVAMVGGNLSSNLAALLDAFYKPNLEKRYMVLSLANDFHSDRDLVKSLTDHKNADRKADDRALIPDDALISLSPKGRGNLIVTDEDIIEAIIENKDTLDVIRIIKTEVQ